MSDSNEVQALRQGLWDAWAALGYDTDGDAGPGALIAGMGIQGFIDMVVRDARTYRDVSEQDYEQDMGKLDAEVARLRAECADRESERADLRDRLSEYEAEIESLKVATRLAMGALLALRRRAEEAEAAVARVDDAISEHPHCIGECVCAVEAVRAVLEGADDASA